MRLIVDSQPVAIEQGDSILIAMLRAGQHPTGGGCLCLGGDCAHCIATVDGVSYVRTCQTPARPGTVVETHHRGGEYPPLPKAETAFVEVKPRNLHCDVVVIGAGQSGRAAADVAQANDKDVIMLDTGLGQEALGIYAGPLVVARTEEGMLHIHVSDEVIVATGAAEIQAVAPGNDLIGIVTSSAATKLAAAGIDLGKVVAIGSAPEGVSAESITGTITRFEGDGKLTAVVVADADGNETTHSCDTVSLGLGIHPRDALARQGHDMPEVRAVGDAALDSTIPPCPFAGTVCTCSGVSVEDLQYTWDSGFQELELIKRSTLAGTGTCQGSVCMPHLRSFIQDRSGGELQKPFTARPLTKQATLEEIAAGAHHHATGRTALDEEHRALGAQMERSGGWWRPWTYGNFDAEYWAVREAVSIMDVSTLGKMVISGPDALAFLERIYPTQVATIRTGRARYVLMLNDRGYVFDDGMIAKGSDTSYYLTFTSGGSGHAEMWMRDWAHGMEMDVHIMPVTQSIAAINVTGPLAGELLKRAGLEKAPRFLRHIDTRVAGIPCKVFRLSFTGELSFELHHPVWRSVELWRTLMDLGKDLGIKPHGLEALTALRLEKGHVIVNQDTDFDSTPRRIHHEWMVNMKKEEDFLGRSAVVRTNKIELDKQLVGLEMAGTCQEDAPHEGAVIWYKGEFAGHVTSRTYSPVLGKSVMLGWLYLQDGELPTEVEITGRTAYRVETPFYDKEADRARA